MRALLSDGVVTQLRGCIVLCRLGAGLPVMGYEGGNLRGMRRGGCGAAGGLRWALGGSGVLGAGLVAVVRCAWLGDTLPPCCGAGTVDFAGIRGGLRHPLRLFGVGIGAGIGVDWAGILNGGRGGSSARSSGRILYSFGGGENFSNAPAVATSKDLQPLANIRFSAPAGCSAKKERGAA